MWRLGIYTALALLILAVPRPVKAGRQANAKINWLTFNKAQEYQNGDRKFLIFFHADWCVYCRKLEKKVFADTEIINYINDHYIPVRVEIDKEKRLAARFGVRELPDLRFLASDGQNLARWPGYIEKDHLLNILQFIHTDSFNKMSFGDFIKRKQ